jgi:5'-deoxynucleotidase
VYTFGALLMRMNYINRWGLMRNTRTESLSEHVTMVCVISNILAHLANEMYEADVNPGAITSYAVYHDIPEILNGDLPTPVKYSSRGMREEYKKIERNALEKLTNTLPKELIETMSPVLRGDNLTEREYEIVKAADRISALIKCIEENRSGNMEFESAYKTIEEKIKENILPETEFFMNNFLPAYKLTLDELLSE